ncbi:hypothetical protein PVAP13_6NG148730 [Panicum virgatum]|uniref:Uncharacterized protein n=1 Tax=Panicum virgatum TaxID=38727 RepID=A0A8T0QVA7_PANVG|nr:hypothetical protein PVAP13_6NG148730 [Panicum virgatum]
MRRLYSSTVGSSWMSSWICSELSCRITNIKLNIVWDQPGQDDGRTCIGMTALLPILCG